MGNTYDVLDVELGKVIDTTISTKNMFYESLSRDIPEDGITLFTDVYGEFIGPPDLRHAKIGNDIDVNLYVRFLEIKEEEICMIMNRVYIANDGNGGLKIMGRVYPCGPYKEHAHYHLYKNKQKDIVFRPRLIAERTDLQDVDGNYLITLADLSDIITFDLRVIS